MKEPDEPFNFAELFPFREHADDIPPLEPFTASDGAALACRRYAAQSNVHLILLHGSSSHSAYLHPFANYLSQRNIANVYTPDIRGHGAHPRPRGDIGYIGQLEQDIADLIGFIQADVNGSSRFIIGGHSSGAGLALRFGGSDHGRLASGMLLLAPYLGHSAPMVKKNSGGWASPNIPKIIGISVLNGLGIKRYNGARVLRFNLPERYRDGNETLEYSFRLMTGMHPADYRESLRNTKVPLLVLVGTGDEALHPAAFAPGILPYKADARMLTVEGASHLGIIASDPAMAAASRWITEIDPASDVRQSASGAKGLPPGRG